MFRIKIKPLSALLLAVPLTVIGFAQAQSLRDPTRPGVGAISSSNVQQASVEKIKLNSVLISGSGATAILNNKIYTLGDSVQGVKIVRINEQGVWLADGRQFTLYQAVKETKGQ